MANRGSKNNVKCSSFIHVRCKFSLYTSVRIWNIWFVLVVGGMSFLCGHYVAGKKQKLPIPTAEPNK